MRRGVAIGLWLGVACGASPAVGGTPPRTAPEAFVRQWATAWAGGTNTFSGYEALYAPGFRSEYRQLDRAGWLADKRDKAARSLCLQVQATDISAKPDGDAVIVTFTQTFTSDRWCDRGAKTLRLVPSGASWLIASEEQGSAEPCAARCTWKGDDADVIGSYARGCSASFSEDCTFEFDQNCEPTPEQIADPCQGAEMGCKESTCGPACKSCELVCVAPCEVCEKACKDDTCLRACAQARATCHQTCQATHRSCLSGCDDTAGPDCRKAHGLP